MIRIKLIPDGLSKLPGEATDDSIISAHLKDKSEMWRDVKRETPSSKEHLILFINGSLDDYSEENLQDIADSLVENISGLKTHPDGWVEIEE